MSDPETKKGSDAEPEVEFDLAKKKKKKKKMIIGEDLEGEDLRKKQDEAANLELFGGDDGSKVDTTKFENDIGDTLSMKKKKKKKKGLDLGPVDDEDELADDLDDLGLEGRKKKKNKKTVEFTPDEGDLPKISEDEVPASDRPWLERDSFGKEGFLYQELLDRVFKIINSKNPGGSGATQKLYMPPPKLARIGTKKTCFVNFDSTAGALNRKQEHLMLFIFAELGTTGNQDAGGQLILKGKYQGKAMEKVLKQYCKDFVQCKTCKSYDTILDKRDRLFFIQCKICQSERTVQAITKGFVAITNKRSRIRNAAAAAAQK